MKSPAKSTCCASCGGSVELPANFCDMCGIRLVEPASARWKRLMFRFGIPGFAAGCLFSLLWLLFGYRAQ